MFVFVDVIVGVLYINIFLILLLSDVWFITIFSNFVEESLNNVFWCIKVFKFDEVQINYFFLFFFAHILDVISKKPLPCVIHFSTSCIILAVLIRSLIYFQSFLFFFFIFWHVDIHFFQHHLLRRLSFSLLSDLCTLVTNHWPYTWGSFLGSLYHSISQYVCLYVSTMLQWLLHLYITFCNQEVWVLSVLLFQDCFGYLESLEIIRWVFLLQKRH